jgi:hypothetical protein
MSNALFKYFVCPNLFNQYQKMVFWELYSILPQGCRGRKKSIFSDFSILSESLHFFCQVWNCQCLFTSTPQVVLGPILWKVTGKERKKERKETKMAGASLFVIISFLNFIKFHKTRLCINQNPWPNHAWLTSINILDYTYTCLLFYRN